MSTMQNSAVKRSSRTKLNRTSAPTALAALLAVGMAAVVTAAPAVAQEKKPNILFIMGDDIGWMQVARLPRVLGISLPPGRNGAGELPRH